MTFFLENRRKIKKLRADFKNFFTKDVFQRHKPTLQRTALQLNF